MLPNSLACMRTFEKRFDVQKLHDNQKNLIRYILQIKMICMIYFTFVHFASKNVFVFSLRILHHNMRTKLSDLILSDKNELPLGNIHK